MTDVPLLIVDFGAPEVAGQISLGLNLFEKTTDKGVFKLPFAQDLIPMILRALNARQYPDYPEYDRFIRSSDDRGAIVAALKTLNLWEGDDVTGVVAVDVHARLGRQLGAALLVDLAVRRCFEALHDASIAAGGGEVVLRFSEDAIMLASLPWELAHDGPQPLLMAKGVLLGCSRVIAFDHALPAPREPSGKLHLLTLAPHILMDGVGREFEEQARRLLREMLHNSPIEIETLPKTTMRVLRERLLAEPPVDILDYYGHGRFTANGGELLFDDDYGGLDPVSANRLATLPRLPSLIVLHACRSAQIAGEPLTGVATALSAAGVRAVVAMQLTTRMTAATDDITPQFYRELANNQSVQVAVAATRQALYNTEKDGASWYLPALYLRQTDHQPYVFFQRAPLPPNPFAGVGALTDPSQFVGRDAKVKRLWDRLRAGGNISIVGLSGSGKTSLLTLIAAQLKDKLGSKPEVVWLPLPRKPRLIDVQLELARRLGGTKAKATDLIMLLEHKHIFLLLDELGLLEKGDRGLEVRLWLRQLSQDRMLAKVQLVATSLRSLSETFKDDNSEDYSPLHNVMTDILELGPFDDNEGRMFISMSLMGTPFEFKDFSNLLAKPLVPGKLKDACRQRYDELGQTLIG